MQHREIVAIAREGMRDPVLGADFGRQHGARVDAAGPGAEQATARAEHRAELGFTDGGDLAYAFELVLVEPLPDVIGHFGQQLEGVGGEEGRLAARAHAQRGLVGAPPDAGGRLGDQLVDRHADGEREAQLLARFAADPLGDVEGGPEEPLGAAQVEEGVAPAARLDDRGVAPENGGQGTGSAGVELRVRREQHQVGAELAGPAHQHPPRDTRRLRFGGEREHRGAVGAGGRHGERAAPERRRRQPLDGGAKRRRIDEHNGLHRSGRRQEAGMAGSVPLAADGEAEGLLEGAQAAGERRFVLPSGVVARAVALAIAGEQLGKFALQYREEPVARGGAQPERIADSEARAGGTPRLHQGGERGPAVGDTREDRGDQQPGVDAAAGEPGKRADAGVGRGTPRLDPAQQGGIERGNGNVDRELVLPGQPGEQVEVAGDQRRLGDQPDGEAAVPQQRLEQPAG